MHFAIWIKPNLITFRKYNNIRPITNDLLLNQLRHKREKNTVLTNVFSSHGLNSYLYNCCAIVAVLAVWPTKWNVHINTLIWLPCNVFHPFFLFRSPLFILLNSIFLVFCFILIDEQTRQLRSWQHTYSIYFMGVLTGKIT